MAQHYTTYKNIEMRAVSSGCLSLDALQTTNILRILTSIHDITVSN